MSQIYINLNSVKLYHTPKFVCHATKTPLELGKEIYQEFLLA